MDGWVNEERDAGKDGGVISGWTDGRMDGRMDGWMDGWMWWVDGWKQECINTYRDNEKRPVHRGLKVAPVNLVALVRIMRWVSVVDKHCTQGTSFEAANFVIISLACDAGII